MRRKGIPIKCQSHECEHEYIEYSVQSQYEYKNELDNTLKF